MKKRVFIILIITVFLFGFTYAPGNFAHTSDSETNPGASGGTNTAVTTVADFASLVREGQDAVGNAIGEVSQSRKTLKLGGDVLLASDAVLTADIALDLGGYTLDLNHFRLIVRHNYKGSVMIANGTVSTGAAQEGAADGSILLETPRADAVLTASGAEACLSGDSVTMGTDNKAQKVAALAFAYLTQSIKTGGCVANTPSAGAAVAAYGADLDLPTHFGTLGRFTYSSAKPSVLDNFGKVAALDTTDETAELVPTFTPSGESDGAAGAAIPVRVIGNGNAAAWSAWVHKNVIAPALGAADGFATVTNSKNLPVNGIGAPAELVYTLKYGEASTNLVPAGGATKFAVLEYAAIINAPGSTVTLEAAYGTAPKAVYTVKAVTSTVQQDPVAEILQKLFGIESISRLEFAENAAMASGYTEYPMIVTPELTGLGLTKIEARLNFNYSDTYAITDAEVAVGEGYYGTVVIKNKPQPGESVTLTLTLTVKGAEQQRTLGLIFTGSTTSDTEPNATRFETHYSYFNQQVRDGTHQKYEIDQSFAVSAAKVGSIPYAAFRVTDADGNTYATQSADGGITVTFFSGGETYTPVYGADGVFTALMPETGTQLSLADSMQKFTSDAKWILTIDPLARNRMDGKNDEQLFLEYQYCFATDYADTASTYWFVYTDSADTSVRIGNELTLLSLALSGADAAKYDFSNAAAIDNTIYAAVKKALAPDYAFLPTKYLTAPRAEFNLKAMLYPDEDLTDEIDNSDLDTDKTEKDSVTAATHWNWLPLLQHVGRLNLHGMHINDAVVTEKLTQLPAVTGLDISGIFESGYDYNETNGYMISMIYSERCSDVKAPALLQLCSTLSDVEELNVAYCKIDDFSGLSYLPTTVTTVHIEGNLTGKGGGQQSSIGSTGTQTQLTIVQPLSTRADVYCWVNSDRKAEPSDDIKKISANLFSITTITTIPSSVLSGTTQADYLKNTVIPTLPKLTSTEMFTVTLTYTDGSNKSWNIQIYTDTTSSSFAYEVHGNEIWYPIKYSSWQGTYTSFVLRIKFRFI